MFVFIRWTEEDLFVHSLPTPAFTIVPVMVIIKLWLWGMRARPWIFSDEILWGQWVCLKVQKGLSINKQWISLLTDSMRPRRTQALSDFTCSPMVESSTPSVVVEKRELLVGYSWVRSSFAKKKSKYNNQTRPAQDLCVWEEEGLTHRYCNEWPRMFNKSMLWLPPDFPVILELLTS